MADSVVLWDRDGDPPAAQRHVIYWRRYSHDASSASVPRFLEDRAEHFRARYLAFIHDLGQTQLGGKRVVDHLDIGDGFSLWWMTHLAEKSPYKSPRIYECLRLLALEEMLTEMRPVDLVL